MLSQLAQVFSSQGVLVQGTQYAPGPMRGTQPEAACDHKNDCNCFGPKFDQASSKLELSKNAQAQMVGQSADSENGPEDGSRLSQDEKKQVEDLSKRDKEVRAHEQAHMASAGGATKGGANFEYQTGPDGKSYAVGGHVNIDASPVDGNPEATIQKAQMIRRAALAPADPSGQDRSVAASAAQMEVEARKQINEKQAEETTGKDGESEDMLKGGQGSESVAPAEAVAGAGSASPMASKGIGALEGRSAAQGVGGVKDQGNGFSQVLAYTLGFATKGNVYSAYA